MSYELSGEGELKHNNLSNNPLDLDEDTLTALTFCELSYYATDHRNSAYDYIYDIDLSSEFIAVFIKDDHNEAYIAIRGTDVSYTDDFLADLEIMSGNMNKIPYINSENSSVFYSRVLEGIKATLVIIDNYPNIKNITYTGHSLGGSIAFILTRYVYGENGDKVGIPWTNSDNTKSWAYDSETFENINEYRDKIFSINFKGITFNPGVPLLFNPFKSSNCLGTIQNRPKWCNYIFNHIILGDIISNNILLDNIPLNYIHVYNVPKEPGENYLTSKINKHILKAFRKPGGLDIKEYVINPAAKLGGKKRKISKKRKMSKLKMSKKRKMSKNRKMSKLKLSKKR